MKDKTTQVDQNREDDGQLAHQATPKAVGHKADNRRVVTPEQYAQGWLTWPTGSVPMSLVRKLPDGNYLVNDLARKDPDDK